MPVVTSLTSINVRTSAGWTGGMFCRPALLRLQGQFQLMSWLRMWMQSFLKSSFPRRWPSSSITNIFKTTGQLWVFRQKPLKSCGGSPVFHFPVQICDLINIHRLLLFTPQRLVLIEKFTPSVCTLVSMETKMSVRRRNALVCLHQWRICC